MVVVVAAVIDRECAKGRGIEVRNAVAAVPGRKERKEGQK